MELNPPQVREVLLGRRGPWADPRTATDTLDNLRLLVDELDAAQRTTLADSLVALIGDDDLTVATGAVLGAAFVGPHLRVSALAELMAEPLSNLDRAPTGFTAAQYPSVRAEGVAVACRWAGPDMAATVGRWMADPPAGLARSTVLMLTADRFPAPILANARAWLTAADTGVLIRLPSHWHRTALAEALRPWDDAALQRVRTGARVHHWHETDIEALIEVMAGRQSA